MLRSSSRKADVQPGLRVWAYDLSRPADASSGAPKRWLAADAATFASMYIELRPVKLDNGYVDAAAGLINLTGLLTVRSESVEDLPSRSAWHAALPRTLGS